MKPTFRREKGKRANLKTGVSRKQSTPKFAKNKHFLPDIFRNVKETKRKFVPSRCYLVAHHLQLRLRSVSPTNNNVDNDRMKIAIAINS